MVAPMLPTEQPPPACAGPDLGRVNLRLLQCFRAVAEELSFSKAALRLNLSQPPLSLHIKELEAMLATQLFVRTTRSVTLTAAGRALQQEVERMLDQMDRSLHHVCQVGRGERGLLQLGTIGTAVWGALLPALERFVAGSPGATWSLVELNPAQQIEALRQHRIDLGVWREAHTSLPPGFQSQVLGRENILLAVPTAHRLAGESVVELAFLEAETFLLMPIQASGLGAYLESVCRRHGFTPHLAHQVNEPQTLLAMVAHGMGITLLPASYARIHWPGVTFVPLREDFNADLSVVYDPQASTPVVAAFLGMLRSEKHSGR